MREINRSDYHATTYEFPLTFVTLPDGREAIVHCPRDYCRIDIEIAETGECLTNTVGRKPADIFHSRLAVSPDGAFLMSAGWFWHPFDIVCLWPLVAVLENPALLDDSAIGVQLDYEVQSAIFLDDKRFVAAAGPETLDGDVPPENGLYTLDVASGRVLAHSTLPFSVGTLADFDEEHVLALHHHPRLLKLQDGHVVCEWPHLSTGEQTSSIIHHLDPVPAFAKHPRLPRFAVADAEKITVVSVESCTG